MIANINGVDCYLAIGPEGEGGYDVSYTEEGYRHTIMYKCDWNDHVKVLEGLRGGIVLGTRTAPHESPFLSGMYCLSVGTVKSIGFAGTVGGPGFKLAYIPATYGLPRFRFENGDPADPQADPTGKAWVRSVSRTSCEITQVPTGVYYWAGGPDNAKPVYESSVGILRSRVEINATKYLLKTPNIDSVLTLQGSVNEDIVYYGDTQFKKGALLFISANAEPAEDSLDGLTYNLEMVFIGNGYVDVGTGGTYTAYQPEWNEFLATDGKYYKITDNSAGTGRPPYRYSDFWTEIFG